MKLKKPWLLGRKATTNLDSVSESRDITLPTKVCIVKPVVFPVVMYSCDSWTMKAADSQRTDAFKLWWWGRLLRVPLDGKEIKPINPKGNQPWIFTWSTDAEAETPTFWPSDAKSWLIRKDPKAGKDREEEKWATEDELVNGITELMGTHLSKLWEILKDREAWGCCSLWGNKESETT